MHLGTTIESLKDGTALLQAGDRTIEVKDLDIIVPTRPRVPVNDLAEALKARPDAPPVFEIGDCVYPRTAFDAMQEAAALGHRL